MCIKWMRSTVGAIMLASLSLFLFGCGGGGGGASEAPPTKPITGKVSSFTTTSSSPKAVAKSVAASVVGGYTSGTALPNATVTAYAIINGAKSTQLGQTKSDGSGNYTLRIPADYEGAVMVEARPPAGVVAQPVRNVLPSVTKEQTELPPVMLSLATEMMVQYIEQNKGVESFTPENVQTATLVMEQYFGPNFTQTPPPASGSTATQTQQDLLVMIQAFETVLADDTDPVTVEELVKVDSGSGLIGLGTVAADLTAAITTVTNTMITSGTLPSSYSTTETITTAVTAAETTQVQEPDLTDTTAPTAPANLAVASATTTSVALSWDASTDAVGVTAYYVYRNGVFMAAVTTPSYTDTTVAASTQYSYEVKARDLAGNLSAAGTVSATTPAPVTTTYSISGRVTYNGTGLQGVTVLVTGAGSGVVATDADGNYALTGARAGSYTITPSRSGYAFTPTNRAVTVGTADVIVADFTSALNGSVIGTPTYPDGIIVGGITYPSGVIVGDVTYPTGIVIGGTSYPTGSVTGDLSWVTP